MLEEANRFFKEQQTVNEDDNITSDEVEPMDIDTPSKRLQASNILYETSVILEGESARPKRHVL